MRALLSATLIAAAISACGDSLNSSDSGSIETLLDTMAEEAGLSVRDLSVPFERSNRAPAQLQRISQALESGPDGVYVMRYSDYTLRQTLHIFVIDEARRSYVRLTTTPGEDVSRNQSDILSFRYDVQTESLILETRSGDIRLAAQDVTPVGA